VCVGGGDRFVIWDGISKVLIEASRGYLQSLTTNVARLTSIRPLLLPVTFLPISYSLSHCHLS